MRVIIYEYVTAGGWFDESAPASDSLVREGNAMAAAAAADFAQLADVAVSVMRDRRLPDVTWPECSVFSVSSLNEERQVFCRLAAEADWTLVIAPETGGALLRRARMVEEAGGRLLSPPPACVEVAGNKQWTSEVLRQHGVRVPPGERLLEGNRDAIAVMGPSLVAKPIDGCGSQGIRLLRNPAELATFPANGTLWIEKYHRGRAASVAVLCGPAGDFALPACEQRLSADGHFTYLGGALPLAESLDRRAKQLALEAVAAIGPRLGYLGIDLVLGEAPDGSEDVIIEINPRLTTSYVGLRQAARCNLAAEMLAVANGRAPNLCFDNASIEFTADGRILKRLGGLSPPCK